MGRGCEVADARFGDCVPFLGTWYDTDDARGEVGKSCWLGVDRASDTVRMDQSDGLMFQNQTSYL